MKRRVFRILNFFAFNLLFFALYLNFVHKDSSIQSTVQSTQTNQPHGTVLVENPEQYLQKTNIPSVSKHAGAEKESNRTSNLSFN